MSAIHPTRRNKITKKWLSNLAQDQDGYFLWAYVKIATISKAVVSIICNSSYVFIKSLLSGKVSRLSESTSPDPLGKYITVSDSVENL